MPSRRGPRWVVWPAKLFWAPILITGILLSIGFDLDTTRVDDDTWRVDMFVPAPAGWAGDVGPFSIGIILGVFGMVLLGLYFWDPGPGRSLTLLEYPLFTWAAWIFGSLMFLSLFSFTGHVTVLDGNGFAWRFLAVPRTHALDRVLTVVALVAWIACWLASWGLVSGKYARSYRASEA